MFTFGSQINPALGRQDFSAILQGAQNQAKAMGQAAAIRAQGISQLGSSAVQAFNTYAENKEKNAVLEGKNTQLFNAIASDPTTNGVINRSPTIQKLIAQRDQKGGLDLNNNTKLFAELSTAYDLAEKSREAQRQQANAEYVRAQTKALMDKAAEDKRVRDAMSATMAEIGKLGPDATPQQIINIGVANNMPLDNLRSLVGMNIDVAQFGNALKLADENLKRVIAENAEADRRKKAFDATKAEFGGKTYREFTADNGTTVFQTFDPISGSIKTEIINKGATPASIALMREKSEEVSKIYDQYRLLLQGNREDPENIAMRDKLAERLGVINPPLDKITSDRNDLDKKWGGGIINPVVPQGQKDAAAGKGTGKPNIKNAAVVPPTQQPAATAPAAAPANLSLAGASTGFAGGTRGLNQMGTPFTAPGGVTGRTYSDEEVAEQQRRIDAAMGAAPAPLPPPAAPAPDTTIGAPVQAAPPVVLSPEAANPLMAMGITGYGATGFGRSNAFDALPTATTPPPFQRAPTEEEAFPARRTTLGQRMAENARVQSFLSEGQDVMGGPSGEGLAAGAAKGFEEAKARMAREGRLLREFGGTQRFQMDPMGLPMAGSTAPDPRSEAERIALAEAENSNTPDITYRRVMAKLGFPTEAQRNVSAIPFRMEPSDEARTVGTPREEGKKAFEAAARAFGPALKEAKVGLSEQLIPELVKTGQTAVRVAKQMVKEDVEIPLKSYGKGIAAMAKALAEEKRYKPDSTSISRLPSGKVMSITEILADPQAAGLGPSLAATALTSIKLEPKAQRIANDLLEEYRRNEAAAQGRAPVPSLRPSSSTVRGGDDLYGAPNLRRVSGGVGQPTPRYNLQPPEEPTQSDTFRNRMESRELTERNMRNRELERQMEQMLRSRRRSSR